MMMVSVRVMAMALVLASTTSSHPTESALDQYLAGEDRAGTQLLHGATDQRDQKLVRKRSYSPWTRREVEDFPYQSIAVWKPPMYQLSRPYYIPIYGAAGRPPIFFPPQQLINPGAPHHNPPFQGPTYLPPQTTPTEATTKMTIEDRFNGGDNKDDMVVFPDHNMEIQVVPTRRPPRPQPSTHPPLNHEQSSGSRTTTQRPLQSPPRQPGRPPQRSTTAAPTGPSTCVWAIISCCSVTGAISYECFEERGCPGVFWDKNPCDNDFAQAAIASALNYYDNKK